MTETRTVRDPFLGKDVQVSNKLTDRLRGRYACGPTLPNGEPEFGWRQHEAVPIQIEAAKEIERLQRLIDGPWLVFSNQNRAWWRANSRGYTGDIRGAGLYSREEAISISATSRDGWKNPGDLPCEIAIPLVAIPPAIRAAMAREACGSDE